MRFYELQLMVVGLLVIEKNVSYRRLKREFDLDDAYLEDLRHELVQVRQLAIDHNGEFLLWAGATDVAASTPALPTVAPLKPLAPVRENQSALAAESQAAASAGAVPLPVKAPASEAERRQLTVMFCDLVGSTALSTQLDPEDLQALIRAYQQICNETLSRFDGYVARYMGDGILAYFGYPQARERDAERSVHAALAIVEGVAKLNADPVLSQGTALAVRVGIATGLVVVGDLIGEGASQERDVVGETPNLAARLQGVAAPNQVVIGPSTYLRTGTAFDYEDLGLHELKGMSEPVKAWRVVSERDIDLDETAPAAALIGRQEELGLLARAWTRSKAGAGQVVLLSSEAGLGKSALVEALGGQVSADGGLRLMLRCSPYHTNSALNPVIEHFKRVLGWQREDDDAARLEKLEKALGQYQFPNAEAVPLLATLLSLPLPEKRFAPLTSPPEKQRQQTLDTIVDWLLEEAERQPVLQVCEDLQWADPTTLELLGLFIERCENAAVMNLLTYRLEFTPPWTGRSSMMPLSLTRLGREAIEGIAQRVAGGKTLPEVVLAQIVGFADGVPLFVEELTKTVLASGLLRERDDHYELTQPEANVTVPATLQESLMARLDQLGPAKSVAQVGAAIGERFSPALLQRVASEDDATIAQALEQLVAAELLARRGQSPHTTYQFRQGLIREVAYESLLRQRRQALHGAIAQAIEALEEDQSEEQATVLAYHYGHSGHPDKAVAYALRAGDHAVRLHARAEASSYYEQALATARDLGDGPQAQRGQIDAMLKLAAVSASRKDLERDLDNLPQAQALAKALDDQPRLGQALYWLGRVHYARGELVTAADYAEQSLAIADALGDKALAAPSLNLLGRYYTVQGNVARGSELLARSAEQMQRIGNTTEEATAAGFAGVAYAWKGDFSQAFAYADRGLALARQLENPFAEAAAYQYRGFAHLQHGGWAEAIADFSQGREIAEVAGDGFRSYVLKAVEGEAQIVSGNPERALEVSDEAIAFAEKIGTKFCLSMAKRNRAATLLALDERDGVAAACQEAIQVAEEAGELLSKSRACQLLADFWCGLDKIDGQAAEQTILDAIRIQQDFGAEPELARSYLTYARLLRSQGQMDKARAYCDQAIDSFRHMGMAWDLAQAEAMAAQWA